jgi:hypothetical protein
VDGREKGYQAQGFASCFRATGYKVRYTKEEPGRGKKVVGRTVEQEEKRPGKQKAFQENGARLTVRKPIIISLRT